MTIGGSGQMDKRNTFLYGMDEKVKSNYKLIWKTWMSTAYLLEEKRNKLLFATMLCILFYLIIAATQRRAVFNMLEALGTWEKWGPETMAKIFKFTAWKSLLLEEVPF